MFSFKSILTSYIFLLFLSAEGQVNPQIKVPSPSLPDIASVFDLLDIIAESLKMEGDIKLTSTLLGIQSQINQDLNLYGACRPLPVHLFLDGYKLTDVYIENSPIEKEFTHGTTKIHYSSKNDLTFITNQETVILTGILNTNTGNECNVLKINLKKYTSLCQQSNNKLSQVSTILWNISTPNSGQFIQNEILVKAKKLKSLTDSINDLTHERELCETKKSQIKEKVKNLNEQVLKLKKDKSKNAELLKGYQIVLQNLKTKIKGEQKKYREKEEYYNSLCASNQCNCPELHGTTCHHNAYGTFSCEEWKQQIPCDADFECQKDEQLDLIKQSIQLYSEKEQNYRVKIDTLRNRISRTQRKIEANDEKKKKYSDKYRTLNCDSIDDIISKIELLKEPLAESIKSNLSNFRKLITQFSIHNYQFELLFKLEQDIYQALAENKNEKSQKLRLEYLELLGSLRSNQSYSIIFNQIKFADPVVLWKK